MSKTVLWTSYFTETYGLHKFTPRTESKGNKFNLNCTVPENIHTTPMEGQWKFQGEGVGKIKVLKEKYGAKFESLEGWAVVNQKTFCWGWGLWVFPGTTHILYIIQCAD